MHPSKAAFAVHWQIPVICCDRNALSLSYLGADRHAWQTGDIWATNILRRRTSRRDVSDCV